MKTLAAVLCLATSCAGTTEPTMTVNPEVFECGRILDTEEPPKCIGLPGRPYAARLCKKEDGYVGWYGLGEESDAQVEAHYRAIMDWKEEQQRWEQE